jgi:hypothetical protein
MTRPRKAQLAAAAAILMLLTPSARVTAAPAPAGADALPAEDVGAFLANGLFLAYHTINMLPGDGGMPAELLYYAAVIEGQHGRPLNVERVVQLMLFADQVAIHADDKRQIDGQLFVHTGSSRGFLAQDQLRALARRLAQSPPLSQDQLAAMTLALYEHRGNAKALRPVRRLYADPLEAAAAAVFVDRADGSIDGKLDARHPEALIEIFARYRTQPVVPFPAKRGLKSWVTARQFIQPSQVEPLLARHGLRSGKGSEYAQVRKLVRTLERKLHPRPDMLPAGGNQISGDQWQYPEETLRTRGGDCEDLAFVVQSCLTALQIESRLVFGRVWSPALGRWEAHVWVEWQDKVLDLAYRNTPGGAISNRIDDSSPYLGAVWFDESRLGILQGWRDVEPQRERHAPEFDPEQRSLLAGRLLPVPPIALRGGSRPR